MSTVSLEEVIPSPASPGHDSAIAPFRRPEERHNVRKGPLFTTVESSDMMKLGNGFLAIGEDLERRSREWSKMVRLLQQHREALDSAELERDAAYAELERVIPLVQDSARDLETAMDSVRAGEEPADVSSLFVRNGEAIDQLERVAVALTGHFLRVRSAWDQYSRSIAIAQKLRAETHGNGAAAAV